MKRNTICLLIFSIVLILFSTSVLAINTEPYHLKLLAVQGVPFNYTGSDADLFLEIKEGSGRVFLDTYPLTKMDTQISTRFAKEIACNYYKLECNKYDFIFTIKSRSSIIGGPSAGAAVAALTTIAMLELDHNEKVSITGTINSGGIVGPVGGVKEKLDAAAKIGLKKVLIAKGARKEFPIIINPELEINESNVSNDKIKNGLDLVDYGKSNLSLEVVEAMDLDDIIFELTSKNLRTPDVDINENPQYREIMKSLKELLCERSEKIEQEFDNNNIYFNQTIKDSSLEKYEKAENATKVGDYYSAASFCFGNNIILKDYYYQQQEPSLEVINSLFSVLESQIRNLQNELQHKKIETISDLQTLMVVKERLNDVEQQLKKVKGSETENPEDLYSTLAYAEERYFSALSWEKFFSMPGKKYTFNQEVLASSCTQKISEAKERYQYANLFLPPIAISDIQEKIDIAEASFARQEPELCLIKASQAKASANAVLSSLGLTDETFPEYIESKSKAVEKVIFENSKENIFPILGYSHYQYALSLKDQEPASALIYLEYALEISDLGIYFPEEQHFFENVGVSSRFNVSNSKINQWLFFIAGLVIGILLVIIILIINHEFEKPPQLKFVRKK